MEKKQFIKDSKDLFDLSLKYYKILCAINDIHLAPRQYEMLAFMSSKGGTLGGSWRYLYIEEYGSSYQTILQTLKVLKDNKLIIKSGRKYTINPLIKFSEDNLLLIINLKCPERLS